MGEPGVEVAREALLRAYERARVDESWTEDELEDIAFVLDQLHGCCAPHLRLDLPRKSPFWRRFF